MKKGKSEVKKAQRKTNNGVPSVTCPYCGCILKGWMVMKLRKTTCLHCNHLYRIKK